MPPVDLAPIAERAHAPAQAPLPTAAGLTWRAQTLDDAPTLIGLINAIEEADGQPWRFSLEELVEDLAKPWLDLDADTAVGLDADGTPRAWAAVTLPPDGETLVRAIVEGGVHPEWRGRGIGREVLAWSLARARQLVAAAPQQGLPGRILAYVRDEAPAAQHHLLERSGLTAIRFWSTLTRDLSAPVPEMPLDPALRLVPFSDELDEAVRLAHNDAFRDHWGSQPSTPETWTANRAMFAPAWTFAVVDPSVTTEDGAPFVVGYHWGERYEQDWEVQGYSAGYTHLLGVRRDYRGRGIGPAVLAHAMRVFAADGMDRAELSVDTENPTGAYGLYERLGFTKDDGQRMYTIEL
ncbi:GNAT family N-acetyltransferase [Antribacter gilvus]|uniref:GNAT family N-acetyltransferase n=1 Tax=Antribacter gilvus TaxID=2304675 RepID=UPI000F7AA7C9|nr:GNAT family N-acetyltransferase [Antribacter gilvus]